MRIFGTNTGGNIFSQKTQRIWAPGRGGVFVQNRQRPQQTPAPEARARLKRPEDKKNSK
jgi:hypothetical protein